MLEAIDAIVLPFVDALYSRFGYVGVVIAMTIESAAIPIPSEIILPFGATRAARGAFLKEIRARYKACVAAPPRPRGRRRATP